MLIEKLFGETLYLDDLPDGEDKQTGKGVEVLFTSMVELLSSFEGCPSNSINSLLILLWNLCHYKIVMQASVDWSIISQVMNLPVDSAFAFICEKQGDKEVPIVLVNKDLVKLFKERPIYHCGGMVFVASQCRDFYNGKLFETSNLQQNYDRTRARSLSYEAEFLITMKYNTPLGIPFSLDDYQKWVLNKYPDGLKSLPKECVYKDKEFVHE